MLKYINREPVEHDGIENYSGPESIHYFYESNSEVIYMLPMGSKGEYYPLTPLVDQHGYNITLDQFKQRQKNASRKL